MHDFLGIESRAIFSLWVIFMSLEKHVHDYRPNTREIELVDSWGSLSGLSSLDGNYRTMRDHQTSWHYMVHTHTGVHTKRNIYMQMMQSFKIFMVLSPLSLSLQNNNQKKNPYCLVP